MRYDEDNIGETFNIQPAGYDEPIEATLMGFGEDEDGVLDLEDMVFEDTDGNKYFCFPEDVK